MADAVPTSDIAARPEVEIHRADPAERRRNVWLLALVMLSGALLLAAMSYELGGIHDRIVSGEADIATDRFLWMARGSFILLALVGVVTGAVVGQAALGVIREQRYPHSAARVLRDRVVIRGSRAVVLGRLGIVLALAFVIVGCAGAVIGWQLLAYFE